MQLILLFLGFFSSYTIAPDNLTAGKLFVESSIKELPVWEADDLAQFERPEIATIRVDNLSCETAPTTDDFLIDVEQLRLDWDALVARDGMLQHMRVI